MGCASLYPTQMPRNCALYHLQGGTPPSYVCWFMNVYNPQQLVRYHPLVNPNVLGPIFTNLVIFVGLQATKIQQLVDI